MGRLNAVLFTADDLSMITGPPSLRRRYLDMMLSQADAAYAAGRSRFERVLTQRNSLLKRIREGIARNDELTFWDEELAKDGALIVSRRRHALDMLFPHAAELHSSLAAGEQLRVGYSSSLLLPEDPDEETLRRVYQRTLLANVSRDTAAGMTLTGPHRDDVSLTLDGFEASGFASRAQQRTIALSLRLAEVQFLKARRNDPPVLLLDDILSEMDGRRRLSVMAAIGDVDQMLVTGTEAGTFPPEFLRGASLFLVERGSVVSGAGSPAGEGISGS
jgi:DNA replication and repair protein RecF